MSCNHVGWKIYPWSSSFGLLKDMPFFDCLPKVLIERKLRSWEVNPMPPGIEIETGGKTWSDMIGCGAGSYINFVSEKIIQDLKENSIPFLRATEMPISRILAKSLRKIPAPKYFVLEAQPGLEVSREEVSAEEQIAARKNNPGCFFLPARLKGKKDSWNGMDLISPLNASGILATCSLYCTDRIKELAEKRSWTNVKFEGIAMM
jgi:hypothetical protein